MEITLSSSKRGYGLKELISNNESEYWSSDDTLPHYIHISFPIKTYVYSIGLLLSYSADESYTPEKIALYFNNKQKIVSLSEPESMKEFPVDDHVFDVYIIIQSNHSDGKDSHIRMLKVFSGPKEEMRFPSFYESESIV